MDWFIAKIIFQINAEGNNKAQFDEQWRLIQAPDRSHALKKAEALGDAETEDLRTNYGTKLRWEFLAVAEVLSFDPKLDGETVFSRIEDQVEPEQYIAFIQHRSASIRT